MQAKRCIWHQNLKAGARIIGVDWHGYGSHPALAVSENRDPGDSMAAACRVRKTRANLMPRMAHGIAAAYKQGLFHGRLRPADNDEAPLQLPAKF